MYYRPTDHDQHPDGRCNCQVVRSAWGQSFWAEPVGEGRVTLEEALRGWLQDHNIPVGPVPHMLAQVDRYYPGSLVWFLRDSVDGLPLTTQESIAVGEYDASR